MLGYGLSLVGIAAILPQLRLLIQQYFDIGDYVVSFTANQVSIWFISGNMAGH
jgi:hypothetical protein